MRIIKLSQEVEDMLTENEMHFYFNFKLKETDPTGQFLIPKGWISREGIHQGEKIIFSYKKDIVYLGVAATGRKENKGRREYGGLDYPHYFCIDMEELRPGRGTLDEFERRVFESDLHAKYIVQTRSWPRLEDSKELDQLWYEFVAE